MPCSSGPASIRRTRPGGYHEGCMVWRYHPGTRAYEIFAEGGGNTFGLEFDSEGRLFSGHNGGETRGLALRPGRHLSETGQRSGKVRAAGESVCVCAIADDEIADDDHAFFASLRGE